MKKPLQKVLLSCITMLLCINAHSQCIYHDIRLGSNASVTFTLAGGSMQSYGCAPIDPTYWVAGFGATMTMTFSTPQTNPAFRVWGMNDDDSASVSVNGSPYLLNASSATYDPKVVCGLSPGPNGVAFANGNFYGANSNAQGNYSYQNIIIKAGSVTTITVKALSGAGWGFVGASTNCPTSGVIPPVASFQSSDSTICTNDCINFTDLSTGATSWQWTFPGGSPASSTQQNPQVCYLTQGVYSVTLLASNSGGSDTRAANNLIAVDASPPTPVITRSNDTLYCSTDPGYTSYQWYEDTTLIPGATGIYITITHSGNYNVSVSNANGCSIAVGINLIFGIPLLGQSSRLFLFPNPVQDELFIKSGFTSGNMNIEIFDILGNKVLENEMMQSTSAALNMKVLAPGVYFVRVSNGDVSMVGKVVKQ